MKLNLGAGGDIRPGYVNHDIVQLDRIDLVHDLNVYPWPMADNAFDEILAIDLLEHLDDFMKAMEEAYRVMKPGGLFRIRVPYWNSWCTHADPTHRRGFHELRFHFFDPNSPYCKERSYYTPARFYIKEEVFILAPLSPYFSVPLLRTIRVKSKFWRKIVGIIGNTFSNIIIDLEMVLERAPDDIK
ncbi:MAG: class I SAM-dependent methyltransferase [Sphingobacteriaceae bacterium]|nr:class I SAM-dependent methyltransferase [Sphingobacteriaceae bacterium]